MKKIISLFLVLLLGVFARSALALDPVAPVSERAFGQVEVISPLPDDVCVLSGGKVGTQNFKPRETIKVPVGEYQLTVKMQDGYEWKTPVSVYPTERTTISVIGYGNIHVNAAAGAKVDVYTTDGKLLKSFPASKTQTLPTGTYRVKIRSKGKSEIEVSVFSNATQEISLR